MTERDGFHVNVSVGWTSALAGLLLWPRTPSVAAAVLWIEAGNAAMHSAMAVRKRRYNPGVASVVLLMAPHAIAGARRIQRSGRLSPRAGLLATAAGLGMRMRGAERGTRA